MGDLKPGNTLRNSFWTWPGIFIFANMIHPFFPIWNGGQAGLVGKNATAVTQVMKEYYRLATIRKPEFMGWSRVEEPGYGRGGIPL